VQLGEESGPLSSEILSLRLELADQRLEPRHVAGRLPCIGSIDWTPGDGGIALRVVVEVTVVAEFLARQHQLAFDGFETIPDGE
jgi:hypothetical protein